MPIGGFSTPRPGLPHPVGAHALTRSSAWRLGAFPVRVAQYEDRRVLVIGLCGASDDEVRGLADHLVPADAAWRWPGAYAVVEEAPGGVVVHTDPASALPLYAVAWGGTWAWSTSARFLAALAGTRIDPERLACAVLAPSLPVLAEGRSFFAGVVRLPAGCRVVLPDDGGPRTHSVQWRPDAVGGAPHVRLRDALGSGVRLRAAIDPGLSSDLSGGLDSTTIAGIAAAVVDSPLHAVTVHPAGILDGADVSYARLAANASQGRIAHRLLPLTAEHRPYTRLREVPVTDEPAPSALTHARFLGQLRWMHRTLGTRTHLTGDGGDSVLFQPPAHLADLIRHGRHRRAAGEAVGWARLRRTPVAPLLRDAATMARTPRARSLERLAARLAAGPGARENAGNVRWFPTLPMPSWATPDALGLLGRAAERAAAGPDELPGLDASVRVLVDDIREVARTAVADAELAAGCGIDLHNPFLDARVMDAVLRTPLGGRAPLHAYKPTLVRAFADVLPAEVRARTTKGSFEADHFTGMRAALPELLDQAGLHLASLDLIDLSLFRAGLRRAAAGVPMPLATIEQALAVDAWLHAISLAPTPRWASPVPGKAI
ncbi:MULTISPECIES: albusnodin/ikarugamycin family macrolactam cyclase [Streptomyces]|uniref:Macrolactam synthetase C n=2 Tax=Streptomyces venezuelae TaxID=54571 RepID=A0A1V0D9A4_STRVZ|nr:albusnodin/ikarugamycin family macrolactam cyclase [Streptomyces venezuelae]APE22251.1 asparagine synthase [Streptomyces venezuelae]ARA91564.1 macrolactam synthetase C [Streptomyces venezuelae]QER99635.1 asparagine synthetase B family protein [Streptomyces venezuelae ATCC 10712]CCA56404.1 putative asparagine synthetase [Streptomyces venezuelae ATCC 10712]